jgi:hypothetical protein
LPLERTGYAGAQCQEVSRIRALRTNMFTSTRSTLFRFLAFLCGLLILSSVAHGYGAPPPSPIDVQVLDSQTGQPVPDLLIIYDGNREPQQTLKERIQNTWWTVTHPKVWGMKVKYWRARSDTLRTGFDGKFTIDPIGPTWLKLQAPGYKPRRIRSPEDYLPDDRCCGCRADTLWIARM